MKTRSGFTCVELLLTSALLAVLLLSGLLAARSATTVAQDSIKTGAVQHRAVRALDQVRTFVGDASRATLEAIPAGGGAVEPMQDDVVYDNVIFRRAISNGPAGQVVEPALGDPPFSLAYQAGPAGREGTLVWTDERGPHVLCGGIRAVEIVRVGARLTVRVTAAGNGPQPERSSSVRSLVLRNP